MSSEPTTPSPAMAGGDYETMQEYANRMATRMAIPAGALVFLLVILLNMDRSSIPMLADPMLEDMRAFGAILFLSMFPITLITTGIAFYLGVRAWNVRVGPSRQRRWGPPIVPIAIAYMLVVGFAIAAVLTFVDFAFQHLHLIALQSAMVAGAAAAAVTYWVVNDAMSVKTGGLLTLVVVIVAGGVYLTAAAIDDPLWWQISFSYLGKMESNARHIFNFTLVFTGVLLLTWIGYFMSDFRILVRHGIAAKKYYKWVRIGLAWLAIGIMFVGIFKSNFTPFSSLMHNLAAYSLAVAFGLLMFGGRWIVPGFSREFHLSSWTLVALLVGTLISTALGRMNTVGLEIVAFALGMTWLSLFVGNTERDAAKLEPESFPDLGRD